MTTSDDHPSEAEVPAAPPRTASSDASHKEISAAKSKVRGKTWIYVGSVAGLVAALGVGYLIGYSTSGVSSARSQRNHVEAVAAQTQHELATVQGQLATAENNVSVADAKATGCSAYAVSLNAAVKTAVAMNQALDDYFNSQPGSAAETAAINHGAQLYAQFEQQRGAANALAPPCTGTAA